METRGAKRRRVEEGASVRWLALPTGPLLRVFELANLEPGGAATVRHYDDVSVANEGPLCPADDLRLSLRSSGPRRYCCLPGVARLRHRDCVARHCLKQTVSTVLALLDPYVPGCPYQCVPGKSSLHAAAIYRCEPPARPEPEYPATNSTAACAATVEQTSRTGRRHLVLKKT